MKLGYVILYVSDVTATANFYKAAFGLEARFLDEGGQYAEMETGSTALAFAQEDFMASSHSFQRNRRDSESAGAEVAFVVAEGQNNLHRRLKLEHWRSCRRRKSHGAKRSPLSGITMDFWLRFVLR